MSEDLLFDNDEHGGTNAGSKESLLQHVREGGRVRVALYTGGDEKRVTVANPVAVYARYNDVYAQLVAVAVGWEADSPGRLTFASPPTSYSVTVSTTGASHNRVVDIDNVVAQSFPFQGVRWYRD